MSTSVREHATPQPEKPKEGMSALRKAIIAGGVSATAIAAIAGGFMGVKPNKAGNEITEMLENSQPGVSGPAVAGGETGEEVPEVKPSFVAEREPTMWDSDPSYEASHSPAKLTPEQIAIWQSGDIKAMNDLASDVFAPRFGVGIYDALAADAQNSPYNWPGVTNDASVIELLNKDDENGVVGLFKTSAAENDTPETEVDMVHVCRTNFSYIDSRCNDSIDNPLNFVPEGGPMRVFILRHTTTDFDAVKQSNGRVLDFGSSLSLVLNGNQLELVHTS